MTYTLIAITAAIIGIITAKRHLDRRLTPLDDYDTPHDIPATYQDLTNLEQRFQTLIDDRLDEFEDSVLELNRGLGTLDNDVTTLNGEVDAHQEQLRQHNKTLDSHLDQIANLRRDLNNSNNALTRHADRIGTLDTEASRAIDRIVAANIRIDSLEAQITQPTVSISPVLDTDTATTTDTDTTPPKFDPAEAMRKAAELQRKYKASLSESEKTGHFYVDEPFLSIEDDFGIEIVEVSPCDNQRAGKFKREIENPRIHAGSIPDVNVTVREKSTGTTYKLHSTSYFDHLEHIASAVDTNDANDLESLRNQRIWRPGHFRDHSPAAKPYTLDRMVCVFLNQHPHTHALRANYYAEPFTAPAPIEDPGTLRAKIDLPLYDRHDLHPSCRNFDDYDISAPPAAAPLKLIKHEIVQAFDEQSTVIPNVKVTVEDNDGKQFTFFSSHELLGLKGNEHIDHLDYKQTYHKSIGNKERLWRYMTLGGLHEKPVTPYHKAALFLNSDPSLQIQRESRWATVVPPADEATPSDNPKVEFPYNSDRPIWDLPKGPIKLISLERVGTTLEDVPIIHASFRHPGTKDDGTIITLRSSKRNASGERIWYSEDNYNGVFSHPVERPGEPWGGKIVQFLNSGFDRPYAQHVRNDRAAKFMEEHA